MAEYKSTLNITQTAFPMKANLPQTEPQRLQLWKDWGFHGRRPGREGAPQYLLHDGPPFANGDIHMGHALNKVLKDIIVKYRSLRGFEAPYVPGWDCHGMPIEHKVMEKLGSKAKTMGKVEIRKECRAYAEKFLERQKEEFKRLGILGDFDHPYRTMDPSYELSLVKALTRLLGEGYVSRRLRPIHWCPVCRTALAEAEVEYADHESLAVTVAFPAKELPAGVLPQTPKDKLSFLIWTTTPWTLPANLGISVHPDFDYVSVKVGEAYYLVAKALLGPVAKACGWPEGGYAVVEEVRGAKLDRAMARHPFLDQDSLVMVGAHVTADAGTGLVHTAPGHGREDYEIGLKYQLPVYSPVNEAGRYDQRVKEYEGQTVWEANPKIVEKLKGLGRLLSVETIKHSYPHCWRSKNPIIFRATAQWFIELDHRDLRQKCLSEIEKVQWIPAWGKDRIRNMVEGRTDWCISRQRSWGVPITAVYCGACGQVVGDPKTLAATVALVEKEGIDGWFGHGPEAVLPAGSICACGSKDFIKEEDILDVWFESGSSHFAVLDEREELRESPGRPSRFVLYLEGSDQHRGWFQHALWTGVALKGRAPFSGVLTHGWVLDGEGKAMHKSAGNVIDPLEMVKKYGADVLRLWVSSENYTEDVGISEEMLNRMSEAYRRIRNTFRFILGNLFDFDPVNNSVADDQLLDIDAWAKMAANGNLHLINGYYEEYQFTKIFHQIDNFFAVELSSKYFDILKDRLYTSEKNSKNRRSAQTVLYKILKDYVVAIAPILSFTAEEIWQSMPESYRSEKSVFLSSFPDFEAEIAELCVSRRVNAVLYLDEWARIFYVRNEVFLALENLRKEKIIGSSLEADVEIYLGVKESPNDSDLNLLNLLNKYILDLRYLFLVSGVKIFSGATYSNFSEGFSSQNVPGLKIVARKTTGKKCARCWNYYDAAQMDAADPAICHRCGPVVRRLDPAGPAS